MKHILSFIIFSFLLSSATSQVRLPALFRDSMVLQRDAPIKIWGWAPAGEKIEVKFANRSYRTTTGNNGEWMITLPSMKAGGPYTFNINARNRITLNEVLIGDVWLCSGQSNMVHTMALHKERYEDDIRSASNPLIRQLQVTNQVNLLKSMSDVPVAEWVSVTPQNVLQFSVVAYYFAKAVHEKTKVPIGLIISAVGGPGIEAWMSEESLKKFPAAYKLVEKNKDTAAFNAFNRTIAEYNRNIKPVHEKGSSEKWFELAYASNDWHTITVPGYWEDQSIRNLNGVVWYRKDFYLNKSTPQTAKLLLGRIVDADEVYLNGKLIGKTYYQYPQRRYNIPHGLLQPGRNTITMRVTNYSGKGGFVPDKPYQLIAADDTIDLKGDWLYKVGAVFGEQHIPQQEVQQEYQPATLFNGMIAPLKNYSIKGFLWYQGEGNLADPKHYSNLLPAMIADWRKNWDQPAAPFLFVQLPNYGAVDYSPVESNWAVLRQAQLQSLSVPNTAMAVTLDLGEWNDLHPWNKREVGLRLAKAALNKVYRDKSIVPSGPIINAARKEGNKVILSFSETGSGLKSKDGEELRSFAIAGPDKKFRWAKTKIENNSVIVWNEDISHPVHVRYAWADNPQDINFYNKDGLPASPFEITITDATTDAVSHPWNNKKAAVVLTYDDALNVHLSNAVPALNRYGLKGTFYISDYFGGLKHQIPGWRNAAENGHELGNHTIFHPCLGNLPGREFVKPETDMNSYTVRRLTDEIKAMNTLLKAIDGKDKRTFAYPCSDATLRDTFYINYLRNDLTAARAVRSEMEPLDKIDLYNIASYAVNGESGEQLIELIKLAVEKNLLLVFCFHGVGGEHSLNVSLEAHNKLLQYLQQHEKDIWIAPMVEVAEYLMDMRENKK